MGEPSQRVVIQPAHAARTWKRTIDIQIILREYLGSLVNGVPRPVEYSSKHVLSDGKFHAAASEFDVRCLHIHTRRTLEYLDNGLLSLNFEDLATTFRTVREGELNDLIV